MPCTLQSDIEFYSMVHEVVRLSKAGGTDVTRRRQERKAFECRQWVAPLVDGFAPPDLQHYPVDCRDISTGGFSYLSESLPKGKDLSLRLGAPGSWTYLTAAVMHCEPVDTDRGLMFQVGCKFTGRVAA